MTDRRLIERKMLRSSLYYQLGESFPGKELHSQRLFQALLLMADDQGRGRFIPEDIRMEAFASARTAFAEVSLQEIDDWMGPIEKNGAAHRYEIKGERYFFLPKWFEYQELKYPKKSHIPPPSEETLANLDLSLSDFPPAWNAVYGQRVGLDKEEGETEKPKVRREEKRREEKRRRVANPDPPAFESGLISELLPNREFTAAGMKRQTTALRLLMGPDRKKIDSSFPEADWPEHVLSILRYMRDDKETRGDWKGWGAVFSSLPRLREKDCDKFINARNSYLTSTRHRAEESDEGRQYHFVDVEAMDREEQEELKRIADRATDTLRPPG